jgi:hypothetical protein
MDTTQQALERLDGTQFEKLCGEVLRIKYPYLTNLITGGINAAGQTRKSLTDSFCFAEQDHYVMVHATTNSSNLRSKWLYDGDAETTPEGDLIKGIKEALKLHSERPAWRFTIFLVTSRRVDEALLREVHLANTHEFVSIEVVEQSALASFLDQHPDGQYLRQFFLDIPADRLSTNLLNDIVLENLKQYSNEIYLDEKYLATVSNQSEVEKKARSSDWNVNLLNGESGFGKSTVAYGVMLAATKRREVVLRITPKIIDNATSLDNAILQQLLANYPKLYVEPDGIAVFFRDALIVIDDINKSENATGLLDKIISWSSPNTMHVPRILCPVWPRNLAALDNKVLKESRYSIISLGKLKFQDGKTIISQRLQGADLSLTEQQMHSLMKDTGSDPLLLSLSLHSIENQLQYSGSIAERVIGDFVDEKIRQIHSKYQYPVAIIQRSVMLLGRIMLEHHRLDPEVLDLAEWLNSDTESYTIIQKLAVERQLFYFDDLGKCFFRHDRVRDNILTRAIKELLKDHAKHEMILSDPFFAELIGAAMADYPLSQDIVEYLTNINPLAVFASLKYLQGEESKSRFDLVATAVRNWNATIKEKGIPAGITTAIGRILMGFDTKDIDVITAYMPSSTELQLAKFRNGNWLSGVKFLSFIDYFFPHGPSFWWNSVVDHVTATCMEQTIEGLASFLPERFTEEGIGHAYTLSGFLQSNQLIKPLTISWAKYKKPENFIPYVWAILCCFQKEDMVAVREALSYYGTIPAENKKAPKKSGLSRRGIDEELRSIGWSFTEEQVLTLIEIAEDEALQRIVVTILGRIDHPSAFNLVLETESKRKEITSFYYDSWDARWDIKKTKEPLSEKSREYLLNQFRDKKLPINRRYLAWRYWTGNIPLETALAELQTIHPNDEVLYDHSVFFRIINCDITAVPDLITSLKYKPHRMRIFYHLWNDETKAVFKKWFAKAVADRNGEFVHDGIEQLVAINNQDGADILAEHWDQIKDCHNAIGAALYLSTPVIRELARKEIGRLGFDSFSRIEEYYQGPLEGRFIDSDATRLLSNEEKQNAHFLAEEFKYLYMHYGCHYEGFKNRLTQEKMESLVPYFSIMGHFTLSRLAEDCMRYNLRSWCLKHLYPFLGREDQKDILPGKEDILEEIIQKCDELEKEKRISVSHWAEKLEKRDVTSEMIEQALKSFVETHHSNNAFFLVCKILEEIGTRKQLNILDNFVAAIDADIQKTEYWRRNAIFIVKRKSLL